MVMKLSYLHAYIWDIIDTSNTFKSVFVNGKKEKKWKKVINQSTDKKKLKI